MAETFFDFLYPNPPVDSFISISHKVGKKFIPLNFFPASQATEADAFVRAQSEAGHEVYSTVALLNQRPTTGRGTAGHIGYVSAFFMDCDIFNAANPHAHANKDKIPQDDEELKSFLQRLAVETHLPHYSLMVHSGNGRHVYWLLNGYLTPSEAAPAHKQFQDAVMHFAQEWYGWKFDPTSDLPRVLRPFGTKNRKNGIVVDVELLEAYPEFRHPVESLNDWAARYAPAFHPVRSASNTSPPASGKPDFSSIKSQCTTTDGIVERMETNPLSVTYYEWFYLASILRHCEDGSAEVFQGVKKSATFDGIQNVWDGSLSRLSNQIEVLGSRANLTLWMGIFFCICGLIALWYSFFTANPATLALGTPGLEWIELFKAYAPRLTLVVLIEVIGFFFLKMYRAALFEIRYVQNEITNIEMRVIAVTSALIDNSSAASTIIKLLAKTDRNSIIEKGQTTIEIEKQRASTEADKTVLDAAVSLLHGTEKSSLWRRS